MLLESGSIVSPFAPTLAGTLLESPAECETVVREAVRGLLAAGAGSAPQVNRRRDRRYPYPHPLRLTPVDRTGIEAAGPSFVVLGKSLSERGIDFYHPEPLPWRWVIATLEQAGSAEREFLLELTWCRFTRHGLYENGGRFVKVLSNAA